MNNVALSLEDRKKFALEYLKDLLKVMCPKDTFNLSINGIVLVEEEFIGIGNEIAPYAIFTNEPWDNGKNPNEGWIDNTIQMALPYISQLMSGEITADEIQNAIKINQDNLSNQMLNVAKEFETKGV